MLKNRVHPAAWRLARWAGMLAILFFFSATAAQVSAQTTAPATPATGQTITITPEDNGQTFHINVGDRVVVKMGDTLDWSVDLDPPGILVPVPGVGTLARGVQGIYEAVQPGTVTLTATGRPYCRSGQVCPQFIQVVQVTIIVGPSPIVGCFPVGDPPHLVCA
jgi:hypothetical protein